MAERHHFGRFDLHFDAGAYESGPIIALFGEHEWTPYRHALPDMEPMPPSDDLAAKAKKAGVTLNNWVQELRLTPPPYLSLDEFSVRLATAIGRDTPASKHGDTAVWLFLSCWSVLPVDTLTALGSFLEGVAGKAGDLAVGSIAIRIVAFDDWNPAPVSGRSAAVQASAEPAPLLSNTTTQEAHDGH